MKFGSACKAREYLELQKIGFDYAEFPCREIAAMNEREFEYIAELVNKSGFPVYAMNIYCPPEIVIAGPGFNLNAAAEYAENAALRAKALGVKRVGIGSPRSRTLPEAFSQSLAYEQLSAFLRVTASAFKSIGAIVCLEALGICYSNFINRIDEAYQTVSAVNMPNLGIVLDYYNMESSLEANIDISPYMDKILHAHLSDDDGDPSVRSYLNPDKRELHQKRISKLVENGYNTSLTLEIDVPFDATRALQTLEIMRSSL